MKLLVYTDLHGNLNVLHKLKKQVMQEKIDLVIDCGDISVMGHQLRPLLTRLNTFKAPVFIIHGNHESEREMEDASKGLKNLTLIHKQLIEYAGWFIGCFSTNGLGEVYEEQEAWVKKHDKEIRKAAKTGKLIWIDHAPVANTTVDELDEDWHAGSISLRKFIEKYQPAYVFCGHFHETFGREDMIGETIIINPGPMGKILELE